MHRWRAWRDPKTLLEQHRVDPGFGHALLSPISAFAFESLGVSASIWEHGASWKQLHDEPNPIRTEHAHGRAKERNRYNTRCLGEAIRTKRPVHGEHAGLSDLFVPIVSQGHALGVLVAGPFATARPTGADVLSRWRALTGRQGHPSDPAFADYLALTLSTLVLDGARLAMFERMVSCIATLMVAKEPADALANETERMRVELEKARSFERICKTVREMLDERTSAIWQIEMLHENRRRIGLSRPPDAVLAGLTVSDVAGSDPVDDAIRRHAFQRRLVEHAETVGDAVAGQIGDHGIVYLSSKAGPFAQRRRSIVDLAERAHQIARRDFGLSLHFGACVPARPQPLTQTYDEALGAAEAALAKGVPLLLADQRERPPQASLRNLRQELARVVRERPELLCARFERYIEAVATDSGFMVAAARGQLDAGFERIAEPLVGRGDLDSKTFDALARALDRAARDARTSGDLFAAYRTAVADMAEAVLRPALARQEQSLRRAVLHVRQHYAEPLSSTAVAKLAGLTRTHFSKLFKEREKTTFLAYVTGLRLDRAKQLLDDTALDAARVAELSGFRSPQYFSRVFRRRVGVTPLSYRARRLHKRTIIN